MSCLALTCHCANHYTLYGCIGLRGEGGGRLLFRKNQNLFGVTVLGPWSLGLVLAFFGIRNANADIPICSGSFFDFPPCDQIRLAAYPDEIGTGGWFAEVYLNLPIPDPPPPPLAPNSYHLLHAETDTAGLLPDFTFRCDAIDFPTGPTPWQPNTCLSDLDEDFITVGDFLNGPIHDVSDPSKLDLPMSHIFIRFTGYFAVKLSDSSFNTEAFPSVIDFAIFGFDGFRIKVGTTVFREILVADLCDQEPPNLSFPLKPPTTENGFFYALGMFPIEVTYFNRFDPNDLAGRERAGIELYSWMGDGLEYPAGAFWVDPNNGRGPMTLMPGSLIYSDEQLLPLVQGDFEGDGDVDWDDYYWFPDCAGGPEAGLNVGCIAWNFDGDPDITLADFAVVQNHFDP